MPDYDAILKKMHDFFQERGMAMPIEYAYGFFDAVAILREFQGETKK